MIANAGLVVRPFVAIAFLVAGLVLLRRLPRTGGLLIVIGAGLFLAAEIYGVIVLRPFVGRYFDEDWNAQIATVDAVGSFGRRIFNTRILRPHPREINRGDRTARRSARRLPTC